MPERLCRPSANGCIGLFGAVGCWSVCLHRQTKANTLFMQHVAVVGPNRLFYLIFYSALLFVCFGYCWYLQLFTVCPASQLLGLQQLLFYVPRFVIRYSRVAVNYGKTSDRQACSQPTSRSHVQHVAHTHTYMHVHEKITINNGKV